MTPISIFFRILFLVGALRLCAACTTTDSSSDAKYGPFGQLRTGNGAAINLAPGDPIVEGGMTPQEVQAVVRANLNTIRHCYEKTFVNVPYPEGEVRLRFKIAKNGPRYAPADLAIVQDTIGNQDLGECLAAKIQRWAFPKPREQNGSNTANVTYDFRFVRL